MSSPPSHKPIQFVQELSLILVEAWPEFFERLYVGIEMVPSKIIQDGQE
jgi:hypothetical protein